MATATPPPPCRHGGGAEAPMGKRRKKTRNPYPFRVWGGGENQHVMCTLLHISPCKFT